MNQDFETQLQVVQRALADVVLPALSGAPGHVIEQLHLSMAALGFMQQRLPHARRYYRQTLASYGEMADAIAALLGDHDGTDDSGLRTLAQHGRDVLDDPAADEADYRRCTEHLRAKLAEVVAAAEGAPYEAALDAMILARSAPILLQERIWCLPLGFELKPEDMPKPGWAR